MSTYRQPTLFISHGGGPGFFMDSFGTPFQDIDKNSAGKFFFSESLVKLLPQVPKAIVVISAHWETPSVTIGYQESKTSLIYDYYGFPEETYAPYLTYDAPTDLQLADQIKSLLSTANIKSDKEDRGFDHGVFCPLKLMYPNADIPVVQVSLKQNLDPASHVAIGRALAPLRDENVLIIGSGQMTHNLREIRSNDGKVSPWAVEFTNWVYEQLSSLNEVTLDKVEDNLVHIMERAPGAHTAHPRTEHLIPLHVAFGAGTVPSTVSSNGQCNHMKATRVYASIVTGKLSLDSYLFD